VRTFYRFSPLSNSPYTTRNIQYPSAGADSGGDARARARARIPMISGLSLVYEQKQLWIPHLELISV
jgi:hypothetical protein